MVNFGSPFLLSSGLETGEADAGKAGFTMPVFLLVKIGTRRFYTVTTRLGNDA